MAGKIALRRIVVKDHHPTTEAQARYFGMLWLRWFERRGIKVCPDAYIDWHIGDGWVKRIDAKEAI